ncbi:GGDEF domain-containing protein [Sulfurimonas sp. HSL-1716]|uniref:GGDEF domain-containing protein n=1 Tax=Hydrocurvibacter sulfurireducens TaxID=3131937 RepID=UPI0031F74A0F
MNKSNAKKILEELYNDITSKIDGQDGIISKDHLLDLMRSTVDMISNLDFELPDALDSLRRSLDDGFKDLAKESIKHYDDTNKKFEELAFKHKQTIDDCQDPLISIEDITDKFSSIQMHMIEEVSKANNLISDLTKKVERLEKTSQIDHLTKVYNRKMLSEHLANICKNLHHTNDIHLFMIDIDDFKIINDTYGHVVGDKVLIFLANILRKTLRDGDRIYRYGGEEFVVILNRIQKTECANVANRIVSLMQTNKLIYKELNINVTVSLGATTLRNTDTPDTLISRADKALYKAKKDGKNRIVLDEKDGN